MPALRSVRPVFTEIYGRFGFDVKFLRQPENQQVKLSSGISAFSRSDGA
jgi:hypothetical protein